jgi:hypothetical protein
MQTSRRIFLQEDRKLEGREFWVALPPARPPRGSSLTVQRRSHRDTHRTARPRRFTGRAEGQKASTRLGGFPISRSPCSISGLRIAPRARPRPEAFTIARAEGGAPPNLSPSLSPPELPISLFNLRSSHRPRGLAQDPKPSPSPAPKAANPKRFWNASARSRWRHVRGRTAWPGSLLPSGLRLRQPEISANFSEEQRGARGGGLTGPAKEARLRACRLALALLSCRTRRVRSRWASRLFPLHPG